MQSLFVEDDQGGLTSITFTFDAQSIDDMTLACILLQTSRSMVENGSRLGIEIDAHIAYFRALEMGMRALCPSMDPKP